MNDKGKDIFVVPDQLMNNEPVVASTQRNVVTMREIDLDRAKERVNEQRRFFTDTLSVDAIKQYFSLLPPTLDELKERMEATEQVLFPQQPIDELVADVVYKLESQNPLTVNRVPLHSLNRVMNSQQFDRERYGQAISLIKAGRQREANVEAQSLRTSGHRYFDDCSGLFAAIRGVSKAPEHEAFRAELFFTAKLYQSLFGANSPWLSKPVVSFLGGPVGAGLGDFHRPVRRNRFSVFEVSSFDTSNTILSDVITQNDGEQQEWHLYCARGSTVIMEHIEPFPLGASLPGMGYQIQYTSAISEAVINDFSDKHVRPHLQHHEAQKAEESVEEPTFPQENEEQDEVIPGSAAASANESARDLAANVSAASRQALFGHSDRENSHKNAKSSWHKDTAFPDIPAKNKIDHFVLQDGDFRGFAINLFAGQRNLTCQPLLVGLQGILPFWGYKQHNRFLLVRDRRGSITSTEEPHIENGQVTPVRTKWQLRRLPLVFTCGQLIPRLDTFQKIVSRPDKTGKQLQKVDQYNAAKAMDMLGRKTYEQLIEERRKAGERSGRNGIVQLGSWCVGELLCYTLAYEAQIAAAAYLVQFLSHANAFEHFRRALAYYDVEGSTSGSSGTGLSTAFDRVRQAAFEEASNLSPPGAPPYGNIGPQSAGVAPSAGITSNFASQLRNVRERLRAAGDEAAADALHDFSLSMMGVVQLERFFGWIATSLRHLPSERLSHTTEISHFDPFVHEQHEYIYKLQEMALTNQKAVNMYCGGDQTNMYHLPPREQAKGFRENLYPDIAKILQDDAGKQFGIQKSAMLNLIPYQRSNADAVENWRLFENTAFAQGQLQFFNTLCFNCKAPDNLGKYLGISILSTSGPSTVGQTLDVAEKRLEDLLHYDLERKCDIRRIQHLSDTDFPHMNIFQLNEDKAKKYLQWLGFKQDLHNKQWNVNETTNSLIMKMHQTGSTSSKTKEPLTRHTGQFITYYQFRAGNNILRDKIPKTDASEEEKLDYDKTLEAILYFYFPYWSKKDTTLLQANKFWPKYVFGLQSQCALLQSAPESSHMKLINDSFEYLECKFMNQQTFQGPIKRVFLNTALLAEEIRKHMRQLDIHSETLRTIESTHQNSRIYTDSELKGLSFIDFWLGCMIQPSNDSQNKQIAALSSGQRTNQTIIFSYQQINNNNTYQYNQSVDEKPYTGLVNNVGNNTQNLFPQGNYGKTIYDELEDEPERSVVKEEIYIRFDAVNKYLIESRFDKTVTELYEWAKPMFKICEGYYKPKSDTDLPIYYPFSVGRFNNGIDIVKAVTKDELEQMQEQNIKKLENQLDCLKSESDKLHISLVCQQNSSIVNLISPFQIDDKYKLEYKDGKFMIVSVLPQRDHPSWQFQLNCNASRASYSSTVRENRGEFQGQDDLKVLILRLENSPYTQIDIKEPRDPTNPYNILNYLDGILKTIDAKKFTHGPKVQYSQVQYLQTEKFFKDLMMGIVSLENMQLQVKDDIERWRKQYGNSNLCFLPQILEKYCPKRGTVTFKMFHQFNQAIFSLALTVYRIHLKNNTLQNTERTWRFRTEKDLRAQYSDKQDGLYKNLYTPNTYLGCILQLLDTVRHAYRENYKELQLCLVTLLRRELADLSVSNVPAGWTEDDVRRKAVPYMAVAYTRALSNYVGQDICQAVIKRADRGLPLDTFELVW